jgi:pSer/pThr/pTyr-binding forkhead associated (FHA) protein
MSGFGYAFSGPVHSHEGESDGSFECRVVLGQREIVLRQGENFIGRAHDAAVRVDDDSVSRRHAVIRVAEGGVHLEDQGSRNGSFRRAERIRGVVPLEDRDEIAVGGLLLLVPVSRRGERSRGGDSSRSTAPLARLGDSGPPHASTASPWSSGPGGEGR